MRTIAMGAAGGSVIDRAHGEGADPGADFTYAEVLTGKDVTGRSPVPGPSGSQRWRRSARTPTSWSGPGYDATSEH